MNEYVNRYFNRNKIDERFASAYEIRKAFESAFMFSYRLFMNRNNFWEPRYWILNDVYVKAMEADAEYLGKLKKENEELKKQIYKMRCCDNCRRCGSYKDESGNTYCDDCDDDMSQWEY